MRQIIVIGGGIAGLATAFEIQEKTKGVPGAPGIICLEALERPGGNIRTEHAEGFTAEWGPNGFLDNVPATLDLVRRLGIQGRLLPSDASSAKRFIWRGGKLRQLPSGPLSFLTSDVLSWKGRLRVLCEPFGPKPRRGIDESVYSFVCRRIGEEAARILVDAMVTGIYAGDSRRLSLKATFPKMHRMESEHGSLTRAMLHRRKGARGAGTTGGGPAGPGGHLTSFQGGLDALIDALARAVGPALRTGAKAAGLAPRDGGGYRVRIESGEILEADALVLACPAWFAAGLTGELDPQLAALLSGIPSASLAVVHLGYGEAAIGGRPDGFGFLAPRGEGVRILGTIWASSVFPGRAPEGKALLTTMIGGARDPEAVDLPDGDLLAVARSDLARTMGIQAEPCFTRICRHPRGIPQYVIGHPERLEAIGARCNALPGLFLTGNSYRGISVNLCADEAPKVARAALDHIFRLQA